MNSFKRKMRKLRRDPKLFFRDFVIRRFARFIRGAAAVESPAVGEKRCEDTIVPVASLGSTDVKSRRDFFCSIGNSGAIGFKPNGAGVRGFRSALIVPRYLANFPFDGVTIHYRSGFSPLSEVALNVGYFDDEFDSRLDEVSLINRVSLKSKQEMEKVDVIFLLDAPANLVNMIGACAPHLRVVTMVTSADYLGGVDSRMVAAVISIGFESDVANIRRLSCVSVDELHFQMRRLIQEQSPKNPNYLLPIRGGLEGFEGIRHFDTNRFGGVVLCSGVSAQKGRTFNEYLKSFDFSISDIWLSESVYLRYKTQCEVIENGGSSDSFFAKALADGVLFDVRTSFGVDNV